MTNAEARFNKSLRPRKPEGSLGRTAQDAHLDSHTAPELWGCSGNFTGRRRIVSEETLFSQIQSDQARAEYQSGLSRQSCFCQKALLKIQHSNGLLKTDTTNNEDRGGID